MVDPAEFPQNQHWRTETGEYRLDEVKACESAEQQPPGADEVGEDDAEESHDTGEETDEGFSFHVRIDLI
jgi:hypothetical protein